MNRSMRLASRPVRAALAVKIAIAILGLNVSVAAAKAYLSSTNTAPVAVESGSYVTPFILPLEAPAASDKGCKGTDEGYGVRNDVCGN